MSGKSIFTKVIVFALSFCLILGLCPALGVFAAAKTDGAINENFENVTSYKMKYQIAASQNTYSYPVTDGGKGGGKAMKYIASAKTRYHRIGLDLPADATATSITEASWDFRVSKFPTQIYAYTGSVVQTDDRQFMNFNGSPSGGSPTPICLMRRTVDGNVKVFVHYNGTDIKEITENDWITVKWFKKGTEGTPYIELYDANGNMFYSLNGGYYYASLPMLCTEYSYGSDAEILIDNLSFKSYNEASFGPSVTSSSINTGDTEISLGTKTVTVTLDQPLSVLSATLTPEGKDAITCNVALKSGYFRTYEISWSDKLTAKTPYTLNLTGSKNAQGLAVDSSGVITFTSGSPAKSDFKTVEDFEGLTQYSIDAATNTTTPAMKKLSVVDGGKGGSKALLFPGTSEYYRIGHKLSESVNDNTISELSYDIRLSKLPTRVYGYNDTTKEGDVAFMQLGNKFSGTADVQLLRKIVNDLPEIWLRVNGEDVKKLTTDDWLHINIFKIGTSTPYVEIYDSVGALIKAVRLTANLEWLYMIGTLYGVFSDAELLIDNMALSSYQLTDYGPSVIKSTLNSGAKDVTLDTNKVTVTLDQQLSALSATLTPNGGQPVTCNVELKSGHLRTYDISWSGNLSGNTTYTLDLTASKNAQNVAVDTSGVITFTTLDPAKEPVSFTGATFSGGGAFTDGAKDVDIKESFTLNFDKAIMSPVANTTILLYFANDDTKTPVSVALTLSSDKKSVKVTPSATLLLNKAYVLDFSAVKSESEGILESETKTLTFTTIENRDAIYVTEDFEGYVNGTLGSTLNSNVLKNTDDSKITVTVEDGIGYKGSKGLRAVITNGNPAQNDAVAVKSYDLADGEYLYYEYKLQINKNNPSTTNGLVIGGINGWTYDKAMGKAGNYKPTTGVDANVIQPWGAGSYWFTFDCGTWLNILLKVGKDEQTFYVLDDNGLVMQEYLYTGTKAWKLSDDISVALAGAYWSTCEVCIDDIKVFRTSTHSLSISDTSYDGEKVIVSFSEPLAYAPAHNSSDAQDAAKQIELLDGSTKIDAKVLRNGVNTVEIIPDTALRENHTYTISYPALNSISAKTLPAGSKSFTTAKAFDVKALGASLEIASGAVNSGEFSVTLKNSGSKIDNAVLVTAFYKNGRPDSLVGLKTQDISVESGESTVNVALDSAYNGAHYAVITVYNASDFAQLSQGFKIN